MYKQFQLVLESMLELEQILAERNFYWQQTQVKVFRGVLTAIMIGILGEKVDPKVM